MNLKVFFITFFTIILAEIFDKTELAIFSLSLKEKDKISIFLGAMSAFFVATLVALFLGNFLAKFINKEFLRYLSAVMFFGAGLLILLGKL
ncbi:MAG TPA: TMEM165/GDT1 family protein [Candidatus Omnitrophica bacterium]|nr:TMEM165/GDT1 family protein [Candidatus Omnitrophota bacterium]